MTNNTLPIWQQPSWDLLVQWQTQQRLPHALLLVGSQSITSFALEVAHQLLCSSSSTQLCGTCQGCRWWAQACHPDFKTLGFEDGSDSIPVDDVRSLQSFVSLRPETGLKVVVLAADKLTLSSTNALLKMLEEPQTQVCFILVTKHVQSLAATMTSRCVHVVLPQATWEQGMAYLQEQRQCSPERASELLFMGQGDPIHALDFEGADGGFLQETISDLIQLAKHAAFPMEVAGRWCQNALQDKLYLIYCLLNRLALKTVGIKTPELNELGKLSALVGTLSNDSLWSLTHSWYELQRKLKQQGIKPDYQVTRFLIEWQQHIRAR